MNMIVEIQSIKKYLKEMQFFSIDIIIFIYLYISGFFLYFKNIHLVEIFKNKCNSMINFGVNVI